MLTAPRLCEPINGDLPEWAQRRDNAGVMTHEVFPFRYRDPLTGKWIRARYMAELQVIAECYAEWELTGPAEIRTPIEGWFNPFRREPSGHLPPVEEPPPDHGPTPDPPPVEQPPPIEDQLERFLVLLFLRRYITY